MRAELTRQCAEVELVKSEGERGRGQLQAEVQQLQCTSAQLEKVSPPSPLLPPPSLLVLSLSFPLSLSSLPNTGGR